MTVCDVDAIGVVHICVFYISQFFGQLKKDRSVLPLLVISGYESMRSTIGTTARKGVSKRAVPSLVSGLSVPSDVMLAVPSGSGSTVDIAMSAVEFSRAIVDITIPNTTTTVSVYRSARFILRDAF